MAATIMMSTQIESAIRDMCTDAMSQTVTALAEKYGFDAEDANRFLAATDVKIVRKRGPSPNKEVVKPNRQSVSDKPKRGKTGYLLYADEIRAEVKDELVSALTGDDKLKPQDVVKAIAARWKTEEQDVRDEWNAKAKTPATSDDEVEPSTSEKKDSDKKTKVVQEKKSSKKSGKAAKKDADSDKGDDSD
tara:strand:+ start:300 stop:869 length:570 start_codon:yes stop_codon:yes gene_type:complete